MQQTGESMSASSGDLGQTSFSEATCRDVARVHAEEGLDLGVLLGAGQGQGLGFRFRV